MNDLKHYGILGMRWGQRRNRSSKRANNSYKKRKPMSQEERLRFAREYTKRTLKYTVASVVVGLAVNEVGRFAAQKYIEHLAKKRFAQLIGG